MTPKEKAKEIYHNALNCGGGYISEYLAGQFSLLMIDELIDVTTVDPYPRPKTKRDVEYWIKVKKELKKLLNHKS